MPTFRIAQDENQQLDLFDETQNIDRAKILDSYVELIEQNKALVIFDTSHFAQLVGFSEEFLFGVTSSPHRFYRHFDIPKKRGGLRKISEPLPTLKLVQRFIVDRVVADVPLHKSAKAYRKNHTLRGAAVIHKGRPYMLNLDIKDFFQSIPQFGIFQIFYNIGYTKQISNLLSRLCTFDGHLPQGAPTSPILSNIYLRNFDDVTFEYCRSKNVFYTRYADDLTFSSNEDNLEKIIPLVRSELKRIALKINEKKTNLSRPGSRKYVNGIVVNEKLNITRLEIKKLRQEMYYIEKFGINGHIRAAEIAIPNYLEHLLGRLNFALFVTRDRKFKDYINYIMEIRKIL